MTDVKHLMNEATPLPWTIRKGPHESSPTWVEAPDHVRYPDDSGPRILFMFSDLDPTRPSGDAALIVYAVNHLPDYEAAVDALLSVAWNQSDGPCWCDHNIGGTEVTKHGDRCQKASAALRRLRGDA